MDVSFSMAITKGTSNAGSTSIYMILRDRKTKRETTNLLTKSQNNIRIAGQHISDTFILYSHECQYIENLYYNENL